MKTVILATGYIASIVLGIALVTYVDPVPVWPGYVAPAAVYAVGLTLVLRDLLQRACGPWLTLAFMVTGIVLSLTISPKFAVASAVAFAISETVDFAVFTALHRWNYLAAILFSGAVALVIDSYVFLTRAFGSLDYLPGQIIGKATATVIAVAVLWALTRRRQAVTA